MNKTDPIITPAPNQPHMMKCETIAICKNPYFDFSLYTAIVANVCAREVVI